MPAVHFAGRLGQADNRTRADVHKPCSLVGRLFPFSVNLRGFRRRSLV